MVRLASQQADAFLNAPGVQQNRASDPSQSVWVAASAGSGKTKVLTDRVLRLLLPISDSLPGTAPEKILCLTFTKAGAAEMAARITQLLARWAVESNADLEEDLLSLLGRSPRPDERDAARRLFAQVIDSPGGLKILTIHSFCQSILARFPLEAGLSPHVGVADDKTVYPLQQKALATVLLKSKEHPESDAAKAVKRLTEQKGEDDLTVLLQTLLGERGRLLTLLRAEQSIEAIHAKICAVLGVAPEETEEAYLLRMFQDNAFALEDLRRILAVMARSKSVSMTKKTPAFQQLLEAKPEDRAQYYSNYAKIFLKATESGDDRFYQRLLVQDVSNACPDGEDCMQREAQRLLEIEAHLQAIRCADLSYSAVILGLEMLQHYSVEKARAGVLDYDDLIGHTLSLLNSRADWVRYKLDQGIDHILIDEAQDTNPEQWEIIRALTGEFFSGLSAKDEKIRTVFAVGDEKQSIFSFQRAAPEKFRDAQHFYATQAHGAGKQFEAVDLNVSFRSTSAVLHFTDRVFVNNPWLYLGLAEGTRVEHVSWREKQAGRVELWPLEETPTYPDPEPWTLPTVVEERITGEVLLANRIAASISNWMKNGERLDAYDRMVQPGDIMILVRTRGSLVENLVRALKSAGVPVSGVDRMVLGEQISVQDILAAATFGLLPEDDLTLACLLKSPFVGMDEETLFQIAAYRGQTSLWSAVRTQATDDIVAWLNLLIAKAGTEHPYEFFSALLHMACPADPKGSGLRAMVKRLGEECIDPLEEFLNTTLQYESENIPSLQQFLAWQADGNTEIKRELEGTDHHDGGKVRIMTIHASKGLQAPIVILPDTVHTGASSKIGVGERLLWLDRPGEAALPLWSPRKKDDPPLYTAAMQRRKAKLTEEYNRLLYVALTRAADRLYITGYKRKNSDPDCWYNQVECAFRTFENDLPANMHLESVAQPGWDTLGYRLESRQTGDADRARKAGAAATLVEAACEDWSWLTAAPPEEESPPRPWSPSRPAEPEIPAMSPLMEKDDQYRFRRGIVTHTLLQFLPNLPTEHWDNAAQTYAMRHQDLSRAVRENLVEETLAILRHPDFSALFGPGSMGEVPITAMIDGRLISGQIDRLLVTDEEIMIVDYKTNRPPPMEEKDVPPLYRNQLRAYRDTLARIYPGRKIRTALLWTDGPRIMEVLV